MEQLHGRAAVMKKLAIARRHAGMLKYIVLHSSHLYEVVINLRALSDNASTLTTSAKKVTSIIDPNSSKLVGTLVEVEVGAGTVPAVVILHGGAIKYNGDPILRADRHLLLYLTALLIKLLEAHAGGGRIAREVIEATEAVSRRIGLYQALNAARDRVEKRTSAINSLQSLSTMIRRANATYDEEAEQAVTYNSAEAQERVLPTRAPKRNRLLRRKSSTPRRHQADSESLIATAKAQTPPFSALSSFPEYLQRL